MEIKTTLRIPLTKPEWLSVGKQGTASTEYVGKHKATDCCRSANWCVTVESRVEGLKRLKSELRYDPASGHVLKDAVQPQRCLCILVHYCSSHKSQEMEPVEVHQYMNG